MLRVVLQMVLSIALTVAAQLVLRRRQPPDQRERRWNGATWGAAVYAFGPLSMLGFFWVVRAPGWRGALLALAYGVASAFVILAVMVGIDAALEAALGPSTWR